MNGMTVRLAQAADVEVIYQMVRESAIEQGGEHELCVDPANLLQDGFALQPPRFQCLLAEQDGKPAGIALYFLIYSTWTSRLSVYLEDIYVAPAYRRQGAARLLMQELARIACDNGCFQARWLVLRENTSAIRFYESIGAELVEDTASARILGSALTRLAEQDNTSVTQ
jgi:GNAT superfamily N-acetyltransferase